jgi:serine protease
MPLNFARILGPAALGTALFAFACGGGALAQDSSARTEARVIVKFRADSPVLAGGVSSPSDEHVRRARAIGGRLGLALRAGRGVSARSQVLMASGITSAELARRLARERDVEYAVPDYRRHRAAAPNDPLYGPGLGGSGPVVGQWYLRAPSGVVQSSINVLPAWSVTMGRPDVVVAVLDTGVRFEHPDLKSVAAGGNLLPGYDMIHDPLVANDGGARDADASDPGDWITAAEANDANGAFYQCTELDSATNRYVAEDSSWHGTQVSGLIAALTNNGIGMAGVGPNLRVLPVRVLGKCGGYDSDIIAAIRWSAGLSVPSLTDNPNRARVVNMSLGGEGACTAAYQDAVGEAMAAGTALVASAGNTEGHAVNTPANCPGIIAVAALRHVGTKVGFSDLGLEIAISAPGGNCVNTAPGLPCLYPMLSASNSGLTGPEASIYTDAFNASVGTSFSAPLVAGTVALMMSANPALTPFEARLAMQATARPFPTTGGDNGDGTPVGQCTVPRLDSAGKPVDQGQCYCDVSTCGAGMLDTGAAVAAAAGAPIGIQAGGMWWDLADAESGWGINLAHQGDVIFGTWFTYDESGNAWWLSFTAYKSAGDPQSYSGQVIATQGPAFSAVPFDPASVTRTTVGVGTIRFLDLNNAVFTYTVNAHLRIKPITRFRFGALPTCSYVAQPDFARATNYQDIWGAVGNAESGWGINFTHQGDVIFATWFTYDTDGKPLWLSATAAKTGSGTYSGELIRTTGPGFSADPFVAAAVQRTVVGAATLNFTSGNAGTFTYSYRGITQTKSISRFLFSPPSGTVCR